MIFDIIGNILIFIGVFFAALGLYGVLKVKAFHTKLLIAAKIDTMAIITVLIGIAIRSGFSFFTLKVMLIIFFIIIVNPILSSRMALSAWENEKNRDEERVKYYD